MSHITYNDLIKRYGNRMAYVALVIIENSAKIRKSHVVAFDCDARLRLAFATMSDRAA
jgi:hypothetical protein